MKKLTLILLIICLYISNDTFGQNYTNFLTINATWSTDLQTQAPFGPPYPPPIYHFISYYKTNGDTILNGLPYTIIDKSDQPKYCYIRQANGMVYCKYSQGNGNDTSVFLLYNFNHELGDTIQLPMAGNPIHYYESKVVSVDSILIGEAMHKKIGINSWIYFEFVEGIGSLQGLFYNEIPWVDWWADLICFSRNDTIFSWNGNGTFSRGNCWESTGLNIIETSAFIIYPNPTFGDLYIKGVDIKKIEIYYTDGRKLLENSDSQLQLQDLINGIYILKVTDKFKNVKNFKIIKNNSP